MISRREFLLKAGTAMGITGAGALAGCASRRTAAGFATPEPFFLTRGAVLVVKDMETYDWPRLAKCSGS